MNTNRQLLIDFSEWYYNNTGDDHVLITISEIDRFLSTLPSEQGSKKEPYSLLGVASEIGVGCDHEWVCGRITCKCSKCEQIGVIKF